VQHASQPPLIGLLVARKTRKQLWGRGGARNLLVALFRRSTGSGIVHDFRPEKALRLREIPFGSALTQSAIIVQQDSLVRCVVLSD
jgi:hypothetical protein